MAYKVMKVTFRCNNSSTVDIFDVILKVETSNDSNKVLAVSEESLAFFEYLKVLRIVKYDKLAYDWFNSGNTLTLSLYSPNLSLKLRKKAALLGLTTIPGENFNLKKVRDLKVAKG